MTAGILCLGRCTAVARACVCVYQVCAHQVLRCSSDQSLRTSGRPLCWWEQRRSQFCPGPSGSHLANSRDTVVLTPPGASLPPTALPRPRRLKPLLYRNKENALCPGEAGGSGLWNPRAVGEDFKRPWELTLGACRGPLYVFTDTLVLMWGDQGEEEGLSVLEFKPRQTP